jgi:hypothetical protein
MPTTLNIPGVNGTVVANSISSRKLRNGIGKFTAESHIHGFASKSPMVYDKMIDFFVQKTLYSNDLTELISKNTPFYIEGVNDTWTYEIAKKAEYPKILVNLSDTVSQPGIDNTEIELVFDKSVFVKSDIITSHMMEQEQQLQVVEDPRPYAGGFKYVLRVHTTLPGTSFISQRWLQPGTEYIKIGNVMGEFSTDFSGLSQIGDKLKVTQRLGEEFGVEHQITDWADSRLLKDESGNPLDITYFATGDTVNGKWKTSAVRWLPTVEVMARAEMMRMKTNKLLWQRTGIYRDDQGQTIYCGGGLYEQLNKGNVVTYNRGEFSVDLLRNIFGDLFYGRVPMKERRVLIYTNEAGFDVFETAVKSDAMQSGLHIVADERFIQGSGMNMTLSYSFNSIITRESGKIELKHLQELDARTTNTTYGQNKKRTPVFMVFDVSTMNDGSMANNIREVRSKSRPGMRWGYVDGAVHHLGFAASQNMSSANKNPWYELWMKDRVGIFVEDVTRTVLIKENPLY